METIDELMYYCKEPEPVGAVLLTGEWGCGITYLIDNELKEALKDKAHVIRISLFGMFDEEMAIVTTEAYAKGDNSTRHQFSGYFNDMWREKIPSKDIKPEESLLGFRKLHELMNVQKEGFEKSGKVFAVRHTEDFIKRIDEMIENLEERQTI